MALQRNNFRRDGGLSSPLKHHSSSSSSSNGVVISHAELPPRQRKRVQVGSTNITRSISTPELPSSVSVAKQPAGVSGSDGNVSTAAHKICETNIALVKRSMHAGARSGTAAVPENTAWNSHVVVHSEKRRLRELELQSRQRRDDSQAHSRDEIGATHDQHDGTMQSTPSHIMGLTHAEAAARDRSLFLHTRKKLYDAFVDRYGSVRAVFKAFDRDANGLISFQRFADMVEASEVQLSPEDVRRVFRQVDSNGDNTIQFQEFSQMFTASEYIEDASAYSPTKGGEAAAVSTDPTSSLALKFRAPLDLSPRTRERMKELRLKVNGELLHKHGRDLGVHGGKTENLLIYAFKQFDGDNDGFLSYDQVKSALGRDYLQLSMDANEMDEMVRMIDRNADEKISMKEFVQYFGAGERELPTDLLDNGRRKELAALHYKSNVALTPRQEVDPEYFERMKLATPDSKALPSLDAGGCMQENLLRRIATSPVFRTPPGDGRQQHFQTRVQTSPGLLSSSQSAPSLSRSKKDYGPTLNPLVTVSQDRFLYWREQRTDWSRVGVGGDGVRPDAALFASESDRLTTTTSQAFSPMHRGVNSGDVFREEPSTSEKEARVRASRRQARHAHTQALLDEMDAMRAKEQRLKDWQQRAKVRKDAEQRFLYLDKIHDQEQRVAMRELQMAKRHGGVRFHRMWTGSPDSQFNNTHVTGSPAELLDYGQ